MTLPPSDHFNGKTFFAPGDPSRTGPARPPEVAAFRRRKAMARERRGGLAARPRTHPWATDSWRPGSGSRPFCCGPPARLSSPTPSFPTAQARCPGPARAAFAPAGTLQLDALPRVDLVLLSHDHFDHCDLPSLRRLARRDNPLVVTPLGYRSLLAGVVPAAGRRTRLQWQAIRAASRPGVTLVPARHWTRRSPFGTNRRLWGGFMLKAGGRLGLFCRGDTGLP